MMALKIASVNKNVLVINQTISFYRISEREEKGLRFR